MITCLVIDDEPFAVKLLEEYISQVPYLQWVHSCYHAMEALEYLKNNKADLIFLDINMPHLSGMQLATLLPPGQSFIFTTAYSEYAVESYEKNAVDYLLKPITFERFMKAITRVTLNTRHQPPVTDRSTTQQEVALFIKVGKAMVKLAYDEIYYIEGLKDYVIFHTLHEKHVVYKRMKELEETLPGHFSRIHLSYIVNRHHIKRIEDHHAFIGADRIPISEKYREAFLKLVNSRLL
jgi:two-component system, LytTR family, response regulator